MFFGEYIGSLADTFVTLELENGHLGVRMKFCDFENYSLTNSDIYNNGEQHLVSVQMRGNSVKLTVDNVLQFEKPITPSSTCNFNSNYLMFGGEYPSATRRKRRETITVTDVKDFSSVVSYKGTIQDVRLGNSLSVQFYDLSDPSSSLLQTVSAANQSGLTEGEISDPVCDHLSPCENNSTCQDVFFNDYR